jgi:hypothetical protein
MVLLLRRRAVAHTQRHVPNLIGIQSKGRQATLKHLVCNDSETSRREYDVQVDERVLREVYLRPFEIAVKESDPSSIMAAYNNVVCIRPWYWIPLARGRDLGKNQDSPRLVFFCCLDRTVITPVPTPTC